MSRRRRPARAGWIPGAGPDRPEARPGGAGGGIVGSRGGNGEARPSGAGRLRPLLVWLVAVGILAAAVLGLRLGAGDVELLVRAPLWLVTAQAGGLVLGAAALVAAVRARGVRDARLARARSEEAARTRHRQFLRRLDH